MRKVVIQFLGEDKSLGKTTTQAEGRVSKLGGTMAKVGKVAALGLAGGVAAAGVALFKMGKAAAEDEAAQKRLAKTLQNTAGATQGQISAVEDWISAQGKAYGVADDDLRPALEKLVSATKDVGEAQKLASLAMDVSAGTGKSLEQVSTALMKAQNGQVSGLARLGVNVKDAEGKTVSFEEAQRRLGKTFKGQAATSANTLEGKMNRLKLMLSETGEEIGAKLLPVAIKLADWFLKDGLPKMEAFGRFLGTVLPPIFERVRSVISSVMGGLQGDVGGKVQGIMQIFRDAVSIIQSLWAAFGPTILSYLRSTFENVKMILDGAFTVIRGIFATVSALLKGDWKGVWDGIKLILQGAVKLLWGIVRQLWNGIKTTFRAAGIAVKAMVRTTWSGTVALFRTGANWILETVRGLPGKILGLVPLMLRAGKGLLQGLLDGMKNAAGFVAGIAGNVWDAVRGMLNSAIDRINNALQFRIDTPGPGGIDINPPNIPHLARGVSSFAGGAAVLGEHGRELTTLPGGARTYPHHRTEAMFASARRGAAAAASDQPVIVQVRIDGKIIEQILIRRTLDTGRPLQVATLGPKG